MKNSSTSLSLIMLVVFLGLLGLGIVAANSPFYGSPQDSLDCFGAGCGPVEHVVLHNYLVPGISGSVSAVLSLYNIFSSDFSSPQRVDQNIDTPPPKFSLVKVFLV